MSLIFLLISKLEKGNSLIETRHLKDVNFSQTIFVLSRMVQGWINATLNN